MVLTATVAIVRQDGVSVANVGDSQACIMRRDRSLVQLTTPHRVSGPKCKSMGKAGCSLRCSTCLPLSSRCSAGCSFRG
eukprot:797854-Pelagomonas_calceolata.AAC.1